MRAVASSQFPMVGRDPSAGSRRPTYGPEIGVPLRLPSKVAAPATGTEAVPVPTSCSFFRAPASAGVPMSPVRSRAAGEGGDEQALGGASGHGCSPRCGDVGGGRERWSAAGLFTSSEEPRDAGGLGRSQRFRGSSSCAGGEVLVHGVDDERDGRVVEALAVRLVGAALDAHARDGAAGRAGRFICMSSAMSCPLTRTVGELEIPALLRERCSRAGPLGWRRRSRCR